MELYKKLDIEGDADEDEVGIEAIVITENTFGAFNVENDCLMGYV